VEIHWLTAFIDLPIDRFDLGAAFWQQVTESRRHCCVEGSGAGRSVRG
jgi:hypothetical protein